MERINRWKCAVSMFKEKPILGYGPGTYQFHYGVFQNHKDKTIISTNSGDMGNDKVKSFLLFCLLIFL